MTNLECFARNSTKRYLQSIVFVDDEIYDKPSGRPAEIASALPTMKSPFAKAGAPAAPAETKVDHVEKAPYHPKQLVESFAKEGMVCALYEPAENFGTGTDSELFKLCDRADVVILDWDLFNEDGKNILPLITNLVSASQTSVPHHVRLCVIYTSKPDLVRVANETYEALKKAGQTVEDVKNTSTLIAGATQIIVLGKPGAPGRTPDSKALEVAETQLANRVIDEFARMNSGILPAYALHGLAAIRNNSQRILDKFHGEMDEVFLLHRALVIESEDAFDQLPELLSEEVLAVIQDRQIPSATMAAISKEAAQTVKLDPKTLVGWNVNGKPAKDSLELARLFLGGGKPAIRNKCTFNYEHVTNLRIAMGCTQTNSDKRLASLFNVRTRYVASNSPPILGFGTIVRYSEQIGGQNEWVYFFCLMPICDGIRLKSGAGKRTLFPFWKLTNGIKGGVNGRGIIVRASDNSYLELIAFGKPREMLWIDRFEPSASGTVTASQDGSSFWFQGEHRLEWIAQLKPTHAQRIAHDIGQSFSHVGVVEAEWVRLICDGKSE
ncbi:MAG: response regulator receiver domain [Verrucomicrobiales bacterium]|nr:response regulator receiver domain [Verrucomicrobiales bacterium]